MTPYGKAFFDLQLRFGQTVAALSGVPLSRVLLTHTNFYIRFGAGRDFDPAHPVWQEYLTGLLSASDPGEWTYRFYLTRPAAVAPPGLVGTFGCFAYSRLDDERIRIHFDNAETNGHSPLGIERRDHRLADLAALFAHVKRHAGREMRVIGASWLYNIEAYRRLFPASYLATAHAVGGRFQHMPLWGQFVNRHGEINESVQRKFLQRLERQSGPGDLDRCFPFQVLSVEASTPAFYQFYGV